MKKILIGVLLTVFCFGNISIVFAAKDRKGASDQALEHASENSVFNRVSDWFATIGKSKEEKDQILAERKAKRTEKRAEREAKKAAREAQEKTEEVSQDIEKGAKSLKNKLKDKERLKRKEE